MQKKLKIRMTEPRTYTVGSFTFVPGDNYLSQDQLKEIGGHPGIERRLRSGVLVEDGVWDMPDPTDREPVRDESQQREMFIGKAVPVDVSAAADDGAGADESGDAGMVTAGAKEGSATISQPPAPAAPPANGAPKPAAAPAAPKVADKPKE